MALNCAPASRGARLHLALLWSCARPDLTFRPILPGRNLEGRSYGRFESKTNPNLYRSPSDSGSLNTSVNHNLFFRGSRALKHGETIHRSILTVGGYWLFWILCPPECTERSPFPPTLVCQVFSGGLKRPAVDKQSVNSWRSGPPRGQRSPSLKPLVWRCVSPLGPRCLHKAKVLRDCLQTPLLCFVWLSCSRFFSFAGFVEAGGLGGYITVSWLLSCTVRWGLARFQLCLLFPGHIPISGTLKAPSPEHTCTGRDDCGQEDELLRRHLFDRSSRFAIAHMLKKPYGRASWPCPDYLLVLPFVVKSTESRRLCCQFSLTQRAPHSP